MEAYDRSSQDVCSELKTEPRSGLTSTHAEEILTQVGENRLKAKRKQTVVERFFSQFKDAMILILLAAAAISFYVALQGSDPTEFFEPALILLIVILNAIMGTVQESKAERSLEALQNMSAPHARVRRDGQESIIDASKLVPGDIVLIEAGDYIPADGRLISAFNLKVEESALTGESVPVEKDAQAVVASSAPLGDRLNMVYSGCSVTYGHGEAVVTATGMNTEMGHIAGILNTSAEKAGPVWADAGCSGDHHLRSDFCDRSGQWHGADGDLHGIDLSGGFCHPRGPSRYRYHRAVHRCYPAGQAQCHHSKTPRCRDTGRCFGDLLR